MSSLRIPTAMKLAPTCKELLVYIQSKTGVNATKTLEKLILNEGKVLALADPNVMEIMEKTPKDYEKEQKEETGVYAPKRKRI